MGDKQPTSTTPESTQDGDSAKETVLTEHEAYPSDVKTACARLRRQQNLRGQIEEDEQSIP